MIDWYYHDPVEGRVGPFSAEDLRKRFRERRILGDTLVWHHGLPEWQPLLRLSDELGLHDVQPDMSKPPPLPGQQPMASTSLYGSASYGSASYGSASASAAAAGRGKYSRTPMRPKKTLSTGAIVAIVLAVLAIPAIGMLAAIALPSYNDYARRAKAMPTLTGQASAVKRIVEAYYDQTGRCPRDTTPGFAELIDRAERAESTGGLRFFLADDDSCSFEFTMVNLGAEADGKTVVFESYVDGGTLQWDCTGGTLPERFRPQECRSSNYE